MFRRLHTKLKKKSEWNDYKIYSNRNGKTVCNIDWITNVDDDYNGDVMNTRIFDEVRGQLDIIINQYIKQENKLTNCIDIKQTNKKEEENFQKKAPERMF